MISDNSPKQFARARYIGNRGLGFRSILSWTDCPFVLSGNLNLSFDRERACRWLEKLCAEYPAIRAKVAFLQQTAMGWPVPTLVVPTFLDSHCENANVWPNEQTFSSIWQTAHELRAMGYDTIIGIPFTTDDAFDEVSSQLGQIGREVMLFLRNLDELVIRQPDGTLTWCAERADDIVTVRSLGEPEQYWRMFEETGVIPEELLTDDLRDTPGYEIKLAMAEYSAVSPSFMFNYFPTHVRYPFPLVAHATLELTNNRENLVPSKANAFLAESLARLMVRAAESCRDHIDPWKSLRLIAATGSLDPILEQLGF